MWGWQFGHQNSQEVTAGTNAWRKVEWAMGGKCMSVFTFWHRHNIIRVLDDDTNRETAEGAGLLKQLDKMNRGSEESG